ncbi:MAG: hypothetical protein PVSMB1_05400 [Gemmatimonadaceae bacterium]
MSKALSHLDRKSIVAFLFPLLAATGAAAVTPGDHIAQLREVDLKPPWFAPRLSLAEFRGPSSRSARASEWYIAKRLAIARSDLGGSR